MTDGASGVSREESRALWLDVLRWPLKGGMLGGVIALTGLSYLLAEYEGGTSQSSAETRAMVWGVLAVVTLMTLGHFAWRAISCTYPAERPVPWFGDPQEESTNFQRVSLFFGVFLLSFAGLVGLLSAHNAIHLPPWAFWSAIAILALLGSVQFPLGLAGAVVKRSALAATPGRVLKMWQAEPRAARIAVGASVVFVATMLVGVALVEAFAHRPGDWGMGGDGPDIVKPWLRVTLVVLRAAGFYAALVSFRVAGLLVREVPEIREVLK